VRAAVSCLVLFSACGATRIDVGRDGALRLNGRAVQPAGLDATLDRGDRVILTADLDATWADLRPVLRACLDNSVASIETDAGTLHLHAKLSLQYLVFSVHVVPGPFYRLRPGQTLVWDPAALTARMADQLAQARLYAHPFAGEVSAEPEVTVRHVWAVAEAMAEAGKLRRGSGYWAPSGEVLLSVLVP
jgi:hypothetical protein